jgi:hypothetical protein
MTEHPRETDDNRSTPADEADRTRSALIRQQAEEYFKLGWRPTQQLLLAVFMLSLAPIFYALLFGHPLELLPPWSARALRASGIACLAALFWSFRPSDDDRQVPEPLRSHLREMYAQAAAERTQAGLPPPAPTRDMSTRAKVAIAVAIGLAATALGWSAGDEVVDKTTPRLQLLWPNFLTLPDNDRALVARVARRCRLPTVDADRDTVARCLRAGASELDANDSEMTATNQLERLLAAPSSNRRGPALPSPR